MIALFLLSLDLIGAVKPEKLIPNGLASPVFIDAELVDNLEIQGGSSLMELSAAAFVWPYAGESMPRFQSPLVTPYNSVYQGGALPIGGAYSSPLGQYNTLAAPPFYSQQGQYYNVAPLPPRPPRVPPPPYIMPKQPALDLLGGALGLPGAAPGAPPPPPAY